jgi:hypothetical protein
MERPTLTLPSEEAATMVAAYGAAGVILEYGTGGSTEIAADLPGRRVFSVESSAEWLAKMTEWFTANPPKAQLRLHPDVVRIDGRCRTACLYTTLLRITRPVSVLWDDYTGRPVYHKAQALIGAPQMPGRMAVFALEPATFAPERLAAIVAAFLRPG